MPEHEKSIETQLPHQCVVAVYDAPEKIQAAVHVLKRAGFSHEHISVIKKHFEPDSEDAGKLNVGDDSVHDAAIGGALGGLAGAVGAATLISVTGVGMILMTGPLVALTGAIVGAFLGAMRGWGVHESHIQEYENLVDTGKVLLVVSGEPLDVVKADKLLQETEAVRVNLHATSDSEEAGAIDE